MVEEFFKLDTLIGGWYIDEKVCDDLIKLWPKIANESNKAYSKGNFMNNEGKSLIIKSMSFLDLLSSFFLTILFCNKSSRLLFLLASKWQF